MFTFSTLCPLLMFVKRQTVWNRLNECDQLVTENHLQGRLLQFGQCSFSVPSSKAGKFYSSIILVHYISSSALFSQQLNMKSVVICSTDTHQTNLVHGCKHCSHIVVLNKPWHLKKKKKKSIFLFSLSCKQNTTHSTYFIFLPLCLVSLC